MKQLKFAVKKNYLELFEIFYPRYNISPFWIFVERAKWLLEMKPDIVISAETDGAFRTAHYIRDVSV